MLSPLKHISPFDVNMASDAGFDVIVPYTGVDLGEVKSLVQDAMFSRAPQHGVRTAIFIAGKNAELALDMIEAAKTAFVQPFQVHVFADPAGSFTTGAALVAMVGKVLRDQTGQGISGRHVAIFGGTGVVAFCAAVLVAQEGGRPVLVGYDGPGRVSRIAASIKDRFGAHVAAVDGSTVEARRAAVREAEVVLSAAAAGIQVLSKADLAQAPKLLIASDVNAVPPAGLEGLSVQAAGETFGVGQVLGVGALTVGNVKYQTEVGLFRRMLEGDAPIVLGFRDAFELAVQIAG